MTRAEQPQRTLSTDSAPAALFEIDQNNTIIAANARMGVMLGAPVGSLIGKPLADLLTGSSKLLYALKAERDLSHTGTVEEIFVELRHADGSALPMLLTIRNGLGSEAERRFGILFSAPERHAYELALATARTAAVEAAEVRRRFLANISHELRTPLTSITGLSALIERSTQHPENEVRARLISEAAHTLTGLVDDILDFASLDSGEVTTASQPTDVRSLIQGICDIKQSAAAEKGLELSFRCSEAADGKFRVDPYRLRQITRALIDNAVKFTRKGQVIIALDVEDHEDPASPLVLSVSDTGVGFDPAAAARLFKPFEQGDSGTTRAFGGAGLGLAIVDRVVGLLGGHIRADAVPGQGSLFEVTLPLERAGAADAARADVDPASGGERRLRVLCAEDHPRNRIVLETMLQSFGMEVALVGDGQEAVNALADGGFDVVLMDMQMPVMDGVAATRMLRRNEARQGGGVHVPVIMLSANAMPEHVEASLAAGADRHIAKPISPAELYDAISDTLRAHLR